MSDQTITKREVAENFPLSRQEALDYARRTISPRAFYEIVYQTLKAGSRLSVIRMGDGERQLLIDATHAIILGQGDALVSSYDKAWRQRLGVEGLSWAELSNRIINGIKSADFFGPNVNGLSQPDYSVYPWHKIHAADRQLVDNFFVNDWTLEQRTTLLKTAKNVLVLHANPVTANTFARRARAYLDVGIRHIPLASWDQAEQALAQSEQWKYPLALVSAGPASKWIIGRLALQGKVALDLGNAMDHWLLKELYDQDPSKLDQPKLVSK